MAVVFNAVSLSMQDTSSRNRDLLTIYDDQIMISSIPSYNDELLNSAYANIKLIADKIWASDQEDPFRKLNHNLWVQNCKLTTKYRDNGNYQPKRVRDVIPGSWLARYGNYEYNEEREKMYKPGDTTPVLHNSDLYTGEVTEPWMLDKVEEHFTRLTSRSLLSLNDELVSQLQSSATERLQPVGKVTDRNSRRIVQSKSDDISQKKYSILESTLIGKDTLDKDSDLCSLYDKNEKVQWPKSEACNDIVETDDCTKHILPRYTVDNAAEAQLQIRIASDAVRGLWDPAKSRQQYFRYGLRQQRQQYHQRSSKCSQQQQSSQSIQLQQNPLYPPQQHLQHNLNYQPFLMRAGQQTLSPESFGMIYRPPLPLLSAEVPEFFPKTSGQCANGQQQQSLPLQFFPSLNERSYQDELFPYNRTYISQSSGTIFQNTSIVMPTPPPNMNNLIRTPPPQWVQRAVPSLQIQGPVCPASSSQPLCPPMPSIYPTIIQRPLQLHETIVPPNHMASAPIPVYQRPPELYQDPLQRRKAQGVDFNNLILLTKNAMKARRNQSKNPQQTSSFILESRQPNLKSEDDVLQWLNKGYPKRAKEFVTVNTLVSEFRSFESKCNYLRTMSWKSESEAQNGDPKNHTIATESTVDRFNEGDPQSDTPTKRRLYRDVLANSSTTGMILDNVFDKRYDELEQQAMEQYKTSEECLALRYQELEQQAMEQYRHCDNGAGGNTNNEVDSGSIVIVTSKKNREQSESERETSKDCTGGQKCSGFGQCSLTKQCSSGGEKGVPMRQQITILKPENKRTTNGAHRNVSHSKSTRQTVMTKSLTTLNQKFSRDSKNTTKGASGNKMDKTVRESSKRRLILMSPLKHKSEANLTEASDLEETCTFQPYNKHVSYQKSALTQTGGGDEKIAIQRSPRAEGIRKQLFLVNEELRSGSYVRLRELLNED